MSLPATEKGLTTNAKRWMQPTTVNLNDPDHICVTCGTSIPACGRKRMVREGFCTIWVGVKQMGRETNRKCPICGEELHATENLSHTYYLCISPKCKDKIFAIRGIDHYFKCDEIDLKTGKYYPYVPTVGGKQT